MGQAADGDTDFSTNDSGEDNESAHPNEALLLQIAGYLRLIEQGIPAAQEEATDLLEKIGKVLNSEE